MASLSQAQLDQLFASFRALPQRAAQPRTLLQIAGVAHLEFASSNVLAFYLDPQANHGLGTLLLDALLSFLPGALGAGEYVRVEREVQTAKGNRLDLLVSGDDFVLGIENKINHGVINPFDDYWQHLVGLSAGQHVYGIILSYKPVAPSAAHHGLYLCATGTTSPELLRPWEKSDSETSCMLTTYATSSAQ